MSASAQGRAARVDSVCDLIGNTPLLPIEALRSQLPANVTILGKAEYLNPGGSVKDRAALEIVRAALAEGQLGDGKVLLDSTSGNTGVAYAMVGAALGIEVELVMPENVSAARKSIIAAYGAQIIYSDPLEGSDGAIRLAKRMREADSAGRYWYADQYGNPNNPGAHERTTGPEIVEQTGGAVTHFVAALGTSGSVVGAGRALRRMVPGVKVYSVQPDSAFHGLEGMKHLESSIVPAIYDEQVLDGTRFVSTDVGWDMAEFLAQNAGITVGYSAGAAVAAALELGQSLTEGVVVCLLCDNADRYNEQPS